MNLELKKRERERVIKGNKGKGEIGKITGMVADAPTLDSLGKRYEAFDGWDTVAGEVLVVGGLVVNKDVEAKLVIIYVNIKEVNMGGGDDQVN